MSNSSMGESTPGRSPRKHTLEFKKQAVEMVTQQGVSIAEAARRLGIHENQLRRWRKKFRDEGMPASPAQPTSLEAELIRLRAENERLKMERDILKKATAFFAKESR